MKIRSLQIAFLIVLLVSSFQTLSAQIDPEKVNGANFDRKSIWERDFDGVTRIPVCWENSGSYTTELQWVKDAADETWATVANIQFTGWGTCYSGSRGIRINIKDGHPHVKRLGNLLDGIKDGMELNFTFNNFRCGRTKEQCIKWIAAHEFGHAIGLAHEQNRTDCRCSEYEPQGSDGGYYVTKCDQNSIMNYCNPDWNNNGKLSALDIEGVRLVYGEKRVASSRVTTTFEDSLGTGQTYENLYLEIGSKKFVFHVNTQSTLDRGYIYFSRAGNYDYRIYSRTWFGYNYRDFAGSGTINIEDGGNYEFLLNEDSKIIIRKK